jgi:hypothetical protein
MSAGQQSHNRQAHRFRFATDDALDGLLKLAQAMSSGSDQTSLTSTYKMFLPLVRDQYRER